PPLGLSAGSSPCCHVRWWTPPASPGGSILKTCTTSLCGITLPVQRRFSAMAAILRTIGGRELLVYFGYPLAHADDTRRAIHAGLALLTAVHDLGHGLIKDFGVRLAIRVGIHTGLVVVGGGDGGPSYRHL